MSSLIHFLIHNMLLFRFFVGFPPVTAMVFSRFLDRDIARHISQQIKSPDNVSIISLQEILGTLSKLLPVQNFYGAIRDIIGQIR